MLSQELLFPGQDNKGGRNCRGARALKCSKESKAHGNILEGHWGILFSAGMEEQRPWTVNAAGQEGLQSLSPSALCGISAVTLVTLHPQAVPRAKQE